MVDYTIQECQTHGIPTSATEIEVYNYQKNRLEHEKGIPLPRSPIERKPILFVPKRWLRFTPWLDFDDYFASYCPKDKLQESEGGTERVSVLRFNRHHYGVVVDYVSAKERAKNDCCCIPTGRFVWGICLGGSTTRKHSAAKDF